jgi:hypothetical protein
MGVSALTVLVLAFVLSSALLAAAQQTLSSTVSITSDTTYSGSTLTCDGSLMLAFNVTGAAKLTVKDLTVINCPALVWAAGTASVTISNVVFQNASSVASMTASSALTVNSPFTWNAPRVAPAGALALSSRFNWVFSFTDSAQGTLNMDITKSIKCFRSAQRETDLVGIFDSAQVTATNFAADTCGNVFVLGKSATLTGTNLAFVNFLTAVNLQAAATATVSLTNLKVNNVRDFSDSTSDRTNSLNSIFFVPTSDAGSTITIADSTVSCDLPPGNIQYRRIVLIADGQSKVTLRNTKVLNCPGLIQSRSNSNVLIQDSELLYSGIYTLVADTATVQFLRSNVKQYVAYQYNSLFWDRMLCNIAVTQTATIRFNDTTVSDLVSGQTGDLLDGTIRLDGSSSLYMFNSIVEKNSNGVGGIKTLTTGRSPITVQLVNSIFRNNVAIYAAGALDIAGGVNLLVDSCVFDYNNAPEGNAGVMAISAELTDVIIWKNCNFTNNHAFYLGGVGTFWGAKMIRFDNW